MPPAPCVSCGSDTCNHLVRVLAPDPDRADPHDTDVLRCVGCGVRGRWENGVIVNAEDHDIPALCFRGVQYQAWKSHGPFVPDH